tara:strand:- start:858 stop:1049 length:192 start_codon:yes stop_codon:yes gene_type:complete
MKIGDLVTGDGMTTCDYQDMVGIIVETWTNHKNQITTVEVLWGAGNEARKSHFPSHLKLIEVE